MSKTTAKKLTGAALRNAAIKEAQSTGYAVVIRLDIATARRFETTGAWSDGAIGTYRSCPNFNE